MVNEFQLLFLVLFSLGFIADVFFLPQELNWGSDIRFFILVGSWIFISKIGKFKSSATFKLALLFLVLLAFLFTFFQKHPSIERIATWVYIYLLVGIIQQFFEIRKEAKKNG